MAALALTSNLVSAAQAATEKKIPVALQLYSVRGACAEDLPGTLKLVKEMGYAGVEFAGYHGRNAKDMRKLLDDNGLKCFGTHTGLDTLSIENLQATIDYNKEIGNNYLICPWMNGQNIEGWKKLAREFNGMSKIARRQKMWVGYHAHAHDFSKIDGQRPWDIFFKGTDDAVIMQLDTSNCLDAGVDPMEVLKEYPTRARSIHLKENGGEGKGIIGEGKVKWSDVFNFCETNLTRKGDPVTTRYVVEYERGENSKASLEAVKKCFEALKQMGKA